MKVDKVIIYRTGYPRFEYRWTRYSANGRIVGASTEGYKRKIDCRKNALRQIERFSLVEK